MSKLDTWDAVQDALAYVADRIEGGVTCHSPRDLGLDSRCGPVYVGEDFLATCNRRALDYYGGFEYISEEYVQVVGLWTIYSIEDGRVRDHFMRLEHNHD